MSTNQTFYSVRKVSVDNLFYFALAILFLIVALRNIGIYPVVFADEWAYSSYSRLMPIKDAGVPSYLYLLTYKFSSFCGDGFLECVRVMNSLFFLIAGLFIYLVSQRFVSAKVAAIIALFSVGGPINSYSIYFMPEAMFFCGFWTLTWVYFSSIKLQRNLRSALIGVALGILSLIKVHALFLLPAFFVLIFCQAWYGSLTRHKETISSLFVLVSMTFITKYTISYIIAGENGLTLFGHLYSSQAPSLLDKSLAIVFINFIKVLSAQALALVALFSVPIFLSITVLRQSILNNNETNIAPLVIYTILIIFPLLIISSWFTASVAGAGPYETTERLHMRYYNFCFPLFLIIVAYFLNCRHNRDDRQIFSLLLILPMIIYGYFFLRKNVSVSFVDGPELFGVLKNQDTFRLLTILNILSLVIVFYNIKKGSLFYCYLVVPLMFTFGTLAVNSQVRDRLKPDLYDKAGIFARNYFDHNTGGLAIVGDSTAGSLRTLFHIDNINASLVQPSDLTRMDDIAHLKNNRWLLFIGDYEFAPTAGTKIWLNGFGILYRPIKSLTISFNNSILPGTIVRTEGFSAPEPWGTWTSSKLASLEFYATLPSAFKLEISARAFGPNVNKPVLISVGEHSQLVNFSSEFGTIVLDFVNVRNAKIIRFEIPDPTSPESIGAGNDKRQLGLGLKEIKITEIK